MPLKKQLFLRALILVVALPIITSFGLRTLYAYEIDGNIAYESIAPILSSTISLLEIASVFCGFGLFLRAYYEFGWRGAGPILALNAVSALIPYCSAVMLLYITTADPESSLPVAVVYAAINFTADMAILAAVAAVAAATAKTATAKIAAANVATANVAVKRGAPTGERLLWRGCKWSAAVFGLVGLIQKVADTMADIAEFGAPTSINDYVYLATPYLRLAVYVVLGAVLANLAGSFGLKRMDESSKAVPESE